MDHVLSELFIMTPPSWVALHSMAHSFIELCKPLHHDKAMIHEGETMTDFIFLGSKIIADSDCSHETKRHLLLGRKVMAYLDNILKRRDITLLTKVPHSHNYGAFLVAQMMKNPPAMQETWV